MGRGRVLPLSLLLPKGEDIRDEKDDCIAGGSRSVALSVRERVLAQPETPTQKIPDRYIVVFEDGVQRPAALANEHARAYGLQMRFVYTSAIEGYAAVFPNDRALQRVESDPRVAYVEQDQVVRAIAQTLPWGINRIDADVSSTLAGNGSGVVYRRQRLHYRHRVYRHPDLNVVGHVNFRGDGQNTDCTDTERMWPAPWPPKMTAAT